MCIYRKFKKCSKPPTSLGTKTWRLYPYISGLFFPGPPLAANLFALPGPGPSGVDSLTENPEANGFNLRRHEALWRGTMGDTSGKIKV